MTFWGQGCERSHTWGDHGSHANHVDMEDAPMTAFENASML